MAAMLYLSSTSQPRTAAGLPMPLATLTFYRSGTTALATVYDSSALSGELTNPVVADASGVWPDIWLDPDTTYRVILNEASGVLAYDVDPYLPYQRTNAFLYLDARVQAITDGAVVPGAELSFTAAGVPAALYADGALQSALPNPVSADSGGRFPAIYLADVVNGYPPTSPILTVTQDAAGDPVELNWTAAQFSESDEPDNYDIYVSVDGGSFTFLATVAGNVLTYSDTTDDYPEGAALLYYVRAILGVQSLYSNEDGLTYEPSYDQEAFLIDGTYTPLPGVTEVDVLLVGHGGYGRNSGGTSNYVAGGGGGGGQVRWVTGIAVSGPVAVVVPEAWSASGDTTFGALAATVGGGTAGNGSDSPNGASGAGGYYSSGVIPPGTSTATPAQGAGGSAVDGPKSGPPTSAIAAGGGGGGGAGASGLPGVVTGNPATQIAGGNGGAGVYMGDKIGDILGDAGWFGGGGGGSVNDGSAATVPVGIITPSVGGIGGGGAGGAPDIVSPRGSGYGFAGVNGTGGGGGGDSFASNFPGAPGGSGIVVVRWRSL